MLLLLAKLAASGALITYVARQCRKPSSRVGRLLARRMNSSHIKLTQWGLSHVEIESHFSILDVGCGGGRTIHTLASIATDGNVCGVDYSADSVAVARNTNRAWLDGGRVKIQRGTVSSLQFPDKALDLVTAIETHYYWPDLPRDVQEVLRVLKPGGTFLIVAETYRGQRNDWLYSPIMRLLLRATYLSAVEHRHLLADAGYRDVEVFEERALGWICAIGHR